MRTRQALREAMVALAEERPLDAISVRDIVAQAGVGYATFFRHYADKEALLADVADRLTQEFLGRVRPLLEQRDRRGAARSLCEFVLEHVSLYRSLIAGGSGETVRAEMLRVCLQTVAESRPQRPRGPLDEVALLHLVSAILNLLTWWLRHPRDADVATMAEIIERLVLTPMAHLRSDPPKGL